MARHIKDSSCWVCQEQLPCSARYYVINRCFERGYIEDLEAVIYPLTNVVSITLKLLESQTLQRNSYSCDQRNGKDMENMNYYELYYFYSRKDNGSIYIATSKCVNDFIDEDDFLNYLVLSGKLESADNISGINEITEEEYKDMT